MFSFGTRRGLTRASKPPREYKRGYLHLKRCYRVLAIESSCDDSAVCLLERSANSVRLIDHAKVALDSSKNGGIIPVDALMHHLGQLGPLVQTVLERNGRPAVDLVCATQGPGMFSSLAAGLQLAKGLALGWNVPFIGVHHMLGHLLTPRFFDAGKSPQFPLLSLLASGGHTTLVLSKSLGQHEILADSIDIAVGNALDKCARHLGMEGNMLGKELDEFCTTGESAQLPSSVAFPLPLETKHNGNSSRAAYSFSQYASLIPRIVTEQDMGALESLSPEIRRALGIKIQESVFEHIARKTQLAIRSAVESGLILSDVSIDFVCAGGVAANSLLRSQLECMKVDIPLNFHYADPKWCTDNALMIGWAGIELFEAGANTDITVVPIAKWPLSDYKPLTNSLRNLTGSGIPELRGETGTISLV